MTHKTKECKKRLLVQSSSSQMMHSNTRHVEEVDSHERSHASTTKTAMVNSECVTDDSQLSPGKDNEEKAESLNNTSEESMEPPKELVLPKPFTVTAELDVMALCLFVVGIATRMWRLQDPRSIVFDELHYGKYASLYMKRIFFFDSHPPLGKQLLAALGYFAGYDGNFSFDKIGSVYSSSVPVWALRSIPAMFGSMLIPVVYQIIIEMNFSYWTAVIAALLVLLDNALLTQSRFMLMEGILLFFSASSILCLLKFRRHYHSPFSLQWWFWLILMSISVASAVCVKYIGFCTLSLIIVIIGRDYWSLIANKAVSNLQLFLHLIARVLALLVLPICFYLIIFYIHLSILTKAGPHDNIMTSAFQASLEGGLASITRGQPLEIAHGSQITLRHTHGRPCWLHSHAHVYPIRYPDNRGSSHQQQITCYSFKDINNWWIVKRPERNDLMVSEPLDKIKHGDIVQLVHGITSRALNSHDVAAPMSPQNQEVSCYIDYNISMPAQNLWRVDIINRETEGDVWHTIQSQIRLIHVNSTQALKYSGKQLPDWGFHQHEIVTDRVINQDHTIWNVEEHRYTKSTDQKDRERELGLAEFVPMAPTQLTFWEKIWELQIKMFMFNQENVQNHMYSSEPLDWPFLTRGIAYWVSNDSNAQIHLLGNLIIWYSSSVCVLIYICLLITYILRRRRKCYDLSQDAWNNFIRIGEVILCGYIIHYLPFFFADRTLFLHHYFPAFIFKLILTAAVIEHIYLIVCKIFSSSSYRNLFKLAVLIWLLGIFYVYNKFTVFCYGSSPLTSQEIVQLKWKDTWDFIIHKP